MNLYHISQNVNLDYDTYDSAVVRAENEELARRTHPNGSMGWDGWSAWSASKDVEVELLAENVKGKAGVVCASFNAG